MIRYLTYTVTLSLCTDPCTYTHVYMPVHAHTHTLTRNTLVNCVCQNDTALISISLPWVPLLFALGIAVGTIQHHRHK